MMDLSKPYHCAIVEAIEYFKLHPASILYIYKIAGESSCAVDGCMDACQYMLPVMALACAAK
jgi:hypothetical protein